MTVNCLEPMFTEKEILSIREGINGVKHVLPPRFYTDEAIYQYEVEHVLKKHWLFIGRWDQAENPGDYFTVNMWGQSIIIVRDKEQTTTRPDERLPASLFTGGRRWQWQYRFLYVPLPPLDL